MPKLVAEGDATFLSRFAFGYDGLVREVRLLYASSRRASHTALIELSVQDPEQGRDAWCNLLLTVTGVSACRIAEGRTTYVVLSDGIFLGWTGDQLRLDLDPGADYEPWPESYAPPAPDHESMLYFVGRQLTWERVPYRES